MDSLTVTEGTVIFIETSSRGEGQLIPSPNDLISLKKNNFIKKKIKSRDITLPTKVHIVKAMVFPVVITDVRAGP